jgi:hypothetical protein
MINLVYLGEIDIITDYCDSNQLLLELDISFICDTTIIHFSHSLRDGKSDYSTSGYYNHDYSSGPCVLSTSNNYVQSRSCYYYNSTCGIIN